MTFIGLIVLIIIVGVLLWLVNTYVPMAPAIARVLNVVVVLVLVLYILQALGLLPFLDRPLPSLR